MKGTKRKIRRSVLLAVFLLASCKEPAQTAIPRLITELKAKDAHTRAVAALDLSRYGKEAEPALGPLVNALWDQNNGVRSAAALALDSIDTPKARKALEFYKQEKKRQNASPK